MSLQSSQPPFALETLYQSLKQQSYAKVPFAMSRDQIQAAIDAFMLFLSLPDKVKSHIKLKIAPKHRRGDVGFVHRDSQDHVYNDTKDYFHFHPAIFDHYQDYIQDHPLLLNFLNHALPIWQLVYETIDKILSSLDLKFEGVKDKVFATDEVHILLRFLRYEWPHSDKYLAKPHYDAGSFTLAIAESCRGLRLGDGPETLKPVEHQDHTALFFLSSNYQKLLSSDELKPGWHDVIQTDPNAIGKPFARWALVAFIEGHNLEALSRQQTHIWYQPDQ